MMMGHFAPATGDTPAPLKLLVYGGWKTGKTTVALSFGRGGRRLAVIDTERGTAQYDGLVPFTRAYAFTVAEVLPLIAEIRADAGKSIDVLAVDGISILWQNLQPAKEISQQAWGVIKRQWFQLINQITALPIPVILTAREHEEDKQVRPDAEKSILYWPDLAIQLRDDHSAVVRAVRGQGTAKGTVIKTPTAKTIAAEIAAKQPAQTA
jgi:hypothetical protein